MKAPKVRQRPRPHTPQSFLNSSICLVSSATGGTASTNPYCLDRTDSATACSAFCKSAFWWQFPLSSCSKSIHRADAIDRDNCCLPAVSLGWGDWHPVWLWSISGAWRGAQARPCPLCYHTLGLVSSGCGVKLPSNSPRWMNRRCYMWTGCQNDSVNSPSLQCLKMLTHCVWGSTSVSLEVMEAFSLFFSNSLYPFKCSLECYNFYFTCQRCLLALSAHSQLHFRSSDLDLSLNLQTLFRIFSFTTSSEVLGGFLNTVLIVSFIICLFWHLLIYCCFSLEDNLSW